MSKQKGIIKLEGNLGGISFYQSAGQSLARVATGPSKERIAKDAAFKRTRENNKEFGGSAKAGKALRLAMGGLIQTMGGARVTAQLTALFKAINLKSTGVRGKRPIKLSTNKSMLKNFEFNKAISFNSVFSGTFTAVVNTARNEATISIDDFIPDNVINAPAGATHFRLVGGIGIVSDYAFDSTVNSYQPLQPTQDTTGKSLYSAYFPLDLSVTAFTLVPAVTSIGTVNAACSAVVTIGIEFYQQVDTTYYLFAQDNAMKVVNVF